MFAIRDCKLRIQISPSFILVSLYMKRKASNVANDIFFKKRKKLSKLSPRETLNDSKWLRFSIQHNQRNKIKHGA